VAPTQVPVLLVLLVQSALCCVVTTLCLLVGWYLGTPWRRVHLENLCKNSATPLPKGTQRIITMFIPALTLVHVMSQINPDHAPSYFYNKNLNIIIPSTARSSKCSLSFWLSHQCVCQLQ